MSKATQHFPFRATVASLAEQNAHRLMDRARLANRLAKRAEGRARWLLYGAKVVALLAIRSRFPERVQVDEDPSLPRFVVVRVSDAPFALHAPRGQFLP
jgi:hypothetical protein